MQALPPWFRLYAAPGGPGIVGLARGVELSAARAALFAAGGVVGVLV
jgi:hypothetical protein